MTDRDLAAELRTELTLARDRLSTYDDIAELVGDLQQALRHADEHPGHPLLGVRVYLDVVDAGAAITITSSTAQAAPGFTLQQSDRTPLVVVDLEAERQAEPAPPPAAAESEEGAGGDTDSPARPPKPSASPPAPPVSTPPPASPTGALETRARALAGKMTTGQEYTGPELRGIDGSANSAFYNALRWALNNGVLRTNGAPKGSPRLRYSRTAGGHLAAVPPTDPLEQAARGAGAPTPPPAKIVPSAEPAAAGDQAPTLAGRILVLLSQRAQGARSLALALETTVGDVEDAVNRLRADGELLNAGRVDGEPAYAAANPAIA